MQRTPKGRIATAKAFEYLGVKNPGNDGTLFD